MCSKSNVATHAVKNSHSSGSNSHITKEKHTPSALRRMTPLIISGFIFNTICYFAVKHLLPSTLTPDPKWCPTNEPSCDRRDLFAFQVVSLLNLSFLGLLGFYSFYISNRATKNVPQTPQGRYLGHLLGKGVLLPDADYINAVIVIFQGWDFIASIPFEEHCTPIMMTHHTLAFICGFACLWYEVNPYYAVYFGGVCEFSSIFLCTSQLFQYYPPSNFYSPNTTLATVVSAFEAFSQGMFVLTFFLFRIAGWAKMTYMLISDGSYIIKNRLLQRYCPGSGWLLWYLLSMGVILGGLQVYWLEGIANKILEVMDKNE